MRKSLAVLFGLLVCCNAGAAVKPGQVPPPYLGKTLSGKRVSLTALRGDVVIISFWATWCHYCIKELPVWAGMQKIATRRGLHMQVVAVDDKQSLHVFARSVHVLKPHLPGILLTRDPNGDIGKPYGVSGIPVMVMLHRNGTVAYVHVGYDKSDLDSLIKEVNVLLNEPMPQPAPQGKQSR